jgi:hypothetical protein
LLFLIPISHLVPLLEFNQDTERLDIDLPADALAAFVDDLTRRFGEQVGMVNDVLAALAWGEGKGLTRRVWAPVASTLSLTGALYRDGDVAWVLEHAGWHIIEAGEDGQAVYRLAHQAFADHYRRRANSKNANARITEALAAGTKDKDWLDADGYLWRPWQAMPGRAVCWMRWLPTQAIWQWQTPSDWCRHSGPWPMAEPVK